MFAVSPGVGVVEDREVDRKNPPGGQVVIQISLDLIKMEQGGGG